MGNSHKMVIDNIGEMVSGQAVLFHQHLHVDNRIFELYLTAQRVLNDAFAFGRDFHPDDMGDAFAVKFCGIVRVY